MKNTMVVCALAVLLTSAQASQSGMDRTKPAAGEEAARAAAIRTLGDHFATAAGKEAALTILKAQGDFSADAGAVLLDLLDRERSPALRVRAASVFYIIFYDSTQNREAVLSFLLQPRNRIAFERLLVDPDSEVRSNMIVLGQIMVFGFGKDQSELLARTYVPILIRGLGDPDPSLRNETVVALSNFKNQAPDSFKTQSVRVGLAERHKRETDADVKDALRGLLGE